MDRKKTIIENSSRHGSSPLSYYTYYGMVSSVRTCGRPSRPISRASYKYILVEVLPLAHVIYISFRAEGQSSMSYGLAEFPNWRRIIVDKKSAVETSTTGFNSVTVGLFQCSYTAMLVLGFSKVCK